jgi:hypothetical protein
MSAVENDSLVAAIDRLGLVLGAVYVAQLGDVDQKTKAERLSRCGFSNVQIAGLLGTTPNTITVALHHARKRGRSGKTRGRKRSAR